MGTHYVRTAVARSTTVIIAASQTTAAQRTAVVLSDAQWATQRRTH